MQDINDVFPTIMEKVGFSGRFQRIYNWIYIMGLTFCGAMVYMNIILALNIPDHWCYVPGHDKTNFSLHKWRSLTLPQEADNRGDVKFSTCKMYNVNLTEIQQRNYENWNFSEAEITECKDGHQYDRTWYDRTIVTDEDWVCEKDLYITNTFVVSRVTEVIGTLVFGYLGDTLGRRMVYYISLGLVVIGRVISILTTSSYTIFIICIGITGLAVNSLFQSPLIIAMEISEDDQRSNIAMIQSVGWSVGTCLMPLLFWVFRDWAPFMWLTTIPTVMVLLFYKYMIESPRWLISQKRFKEALVEFRKIAKINRRKLILTETELAGMYSNVEKEKIYGLMSLFSGWRMVKNTIIMAFSWCVVCVSYFTLVLYSSQMGGNPFLNFLLQSAVEIPSYFVGQFFGDRIGRRWTNSASYWIAGIVCIPIIILAPITKYESAVVGMSTFIKFLNGITFFSVNLQAMETYPTCIRQTGLSLGGIVGHAVGVLAPYFVYLGTTYDIRYPFYILAVLFFLGGIGALFLPETLHHKLPDSLEEAKVFGAEQKFWSLPKRPSLRITENDEDETTKMNQKIYEI